MIAYFSCGAGDFIAIESFMTDDEKKNISGFYLFTRAGKTIEKLIRLHPMWKDLPVEIPYTPEEIRAYGIYAFYDINHLRKITNKEFMFLGMAHDFSGEKIYPSILDDSRKYTESLFNVQEIHVSVVVDVYSGSDDRLNAKGRSLTPYEIVKIGRQHQSGHVVFPSEESNELSESLGYVAGCKFFYGVDSMLSVWAARQKNIEEITVKTVNPIYRKWRKIYDPFNRINVKEKI